jgi:superfamily II DNA or RNA helicase
MAVSLRPYQSECTDAVLAAKERGVGRSLYVLPTGTGKTVTFSEIIRRIRLTDDRPAMVLAHREELLVQAQDTLSRLIPGISVEIERGEQKASRFAEVIVASLPTIARAGTTRLDWLAADGCSVIVYDEAHHAAADGAGRALQRFGAFDGRSFLVGCTATPHRLDNKPLEGAEGKATFEELVYSYGLLDAIRDGWLCDLRGFVVRTQTDLSGVANRGGDFAEGELARRVDNEARTELAAKHWQELASERPTIVFCASVEHAEHATEAWRGVGARAEFIHGGMSRDDRRGVLDRFRSGVTQVLLNCMIATEGFDHPPVSCIVLLRPTKSWSLYAQMVGRGTRIFEGKTDCLVLDVVDNCDEHSLMTAPRLVDLPAGVDLEGEKLSKAREELDELGARAAHLEKKPGKWREMHTKALEVPLFQVPQTPAEIAAAGALRWIGVPGKGYYLSCGDRREAWLSEDILGKWYLRLVWPKVSPKEMAEQKRFTTVEMLEKTGVVGTNLIQAVKQAEVVIQRAWPGSAQLALRSAGWGHAEPSEKQISLILKLTRRQKIAGFDITQIKTKGQASDLINSLMAQREQVAA